MIDSVLKQRWQPNWVTLVAGVAVVSGLLLTSVSWWFLILAALGTFLPGALRELGWLRDQDEMQMQATHRAGYHAYLVTGSLAFVLVAAFRATNQSLENANELATLFLVLLWFTWFLSSLIRYWGAVTAAIRILITFGIVWLGFVVLANTGSEWTGWTSLIMHTLLALPFFALAALAYVLPRVSGVALILMAGFFLWFFGFFQREHLAVINQSITMLLFVGPLLASGIALVSHRDEH